MAGFFLDDAGHLQKLAAACKHREQSRATRTNCFFMLAVHTGSMLSRLTLASIVFSWLFDDRERSVKAAYPNSVIHGIGADCSLPVS